MTDERSESIISERIWLACGGVITILAAFVRFYELTIKPLHHDEGVNGFFLTSLFRDGMYKYDPANYHGPTLYYIALAFAKIFGLETFSIRASTAVFGVGAVILTLYLRRYLGSIGSLAAALLIAVSPGLVFISRYFIHETFFIFLALGLVLSILLFIEKRPVGFGAVFWIVLILLVCFLPSTLNLGAALGGQNDTAVMGFRLAFFAVEVVLVYFVSRMLLTWNDGRPVYFLLAAACVSLLFATKETTFITLGVMALACVSAALWRIIYRKAVGEIGADDLEAEPLTIAGFRSAFGPDQLLIWVVAILIFAYLFVLFFSSFFTYMGGVSGAFEAYNIWTRTGSKDHTQNGFLAYLRWCFFDWERLQREGSSAIFSSIGLEAPIFILAGIGAAISLIKAKHKFALFTAFWAFGILAAYTIIPYKTPWLALSFLMPMCLIGGYGLGQLLSSSNAGAKALGGLLAVVSVCFLGYKMYDLNFVNYDNNDKTYIYAHTTRGFVDLMQKVDEYADKSGKGKDAVILIVSPEYWPMVWYTRDYKQANYFGHMVDADKSDIIITRKGDQDAEAIKRFSAGYDYIGTYPLRPGVDLNLLVKKEIAGTDGQPLFRMQEAH